MCACARVCIGIGKLKCCLLLLCYCCILCTQHVVAAYCPDSVTNYTCAGMYQLVNGTTPDSMQVHCIIPKGGKSKGERIFTVFPTGGYDITFVDSCIISQDQVPVCYSSKKFGFIDQLCSLLYYALYRTRSVPPIGIYMMRNFRQMNTMLSDPSIISCTKTLVHFVSTQLSLFPQAAHKHYSISFRPTSQILIHHLTSLLPKQPIVEPENGLAYFLLICV